MIIACMKGKISMFNYTNSDPEPEDSCPVCKSEDVTTEVDESNGHTCHWCNECPYQWEDK